MAIPVIMPRQGQSVESCIITKWHKAVGEQVSVGDVLFSYETDKASFEEEATVSGTMLIQFYDEWDDVPVLVNVCVVGNEGESFDEYDQREASGEAVTEASEEVAGEATKVASTEANTETFTKQDTIVPSGSVKVSPRAKNLASKLSIDTAMAESTGPSGRVIERDILKLKEQGIFATQAALASGEVLSATGTGIGGRMSVGDIGLMTPVTGTDVPSELGYRDEKTTNIRKMISKAMMNSLQTTSQLTLTSSFDATEMLSLRKQQKASNMEVNISINDMVVFAVSRVIKNHPALNAHFLGDTIRYFDNVHMGIAVDTERGLLVPTVFNSDLRSLVNLAEAVKDVAMKSKEGTINPDLLQGASFTITNLGTFGIESFTPVINPPQTGILGVNTITQRVKEVDGELVTYPAMGLSLTFDHGALDGAPAARFLQELCVALENFTLLLMQ
ncbi:MAG: dihydrolipoamide acetyltransferase family protein [Vallitaleaceae bacterium]|jgi:pyruvate dehydrogenase E2 component (dihydrolipoamide acetyltransferase)|nr:dihydrolipoamide acetyltransferase family protein [Vallitaleaceae bacterium]